MAKLRRIFVVCNSNYPRGSALSNYVQYLANACFINGYNIILVSNINKEFIYNQEAKKTFESSQFQIEPINISKVSFIRHFQYKLNFCNQKVMKIKKHKICKDDLVILLSPNITVCKVLIKLRNRYGFRLIAPVLEMFDEKNYGATKKQYNSYMKVLSYYLPQFDLILPISSFIEDYYKKKECRTFCLPIMADCQEYPLAPKANDKYRFVLPANGKMKDDLSSMLKGFSLLSHNELSNIEIHICGVKEENVIKALSVDEYKRIENVLVIHKWMKYEELVNLYQQMHFLILAREISQMTKANFPSKVPETMGFGIVPLCSDVGDYTKYYLRDGIDSIFINGSNPEVCKDAIKKAIAMPWDLYLKMSNNARKTVENKFDFRVWSIKIKEVLDTL